MRPIRGTRDSSQSSWGSVSEREDGEGDVLRKRVLRRPYPSQASHWLGNVSRLGALCLPSRSASSRKDLLDFCLKGSSSLWAVLGTIKIPNRRVDFFQIEWYIFQNGPLVETTAALQTAKPDAIVLRHCPLLTSIHSVDNYGIFVLSVFILLMSIFGQ